MLQHRFVPETRRDNEDSTLVFNPTTPTYSFFGGDAGILQNGNVEYCASAGGPGTTGVIYEVTPDSAHVVWKMEVAGQYVYRGQRIPSLIPACNGENK